MKRLLLLFLLARSALPAISAPEAGGLDFFEKKIRPILADKCYGCHAADAPKVKGGLLLDSREAALRGGDSGPAVVPGKLDDSLLIEAIRYGNKDFAMPPAKNGGKLPDEVIHDFEKWVQMGAPDPRENTVKTAATKQETWEKARGWWAWQAPRATAAPAVQASAWPRAEVDRYILAGLEAKGLQPVGDAESLTLLRRVYFDLVGLPPSPAEINAFLTDKSPQALAMVVDRLLASPQFGERWGRHWLDVARYAESSGKDANVAFPHAWRYRDYVIAAFNEDKPFDRFIREQLAGDLLPARNDAERAAQLVATGFLALGPKGMNEQNPRQFALDLADEQLDATAQAFLGLTVACARCHDHKFDPIPQKDYYSLAGIFLSTETRYGTAGSIQNRHPAELVELPAGAHAGLVERAIAPAERARKEQQLAELREELRQSFADRLRMRAAPAPEGGDAAQRQRRNLGLLVQTGALEAELKTYAEDGSPKALCMGVQDLPAGGGGYGFFDRMRGGLGGAAPGGRYRGQRPPEFARIGDSAVYARGEADKPGEKAPRGFLTLLGTVPAPAIPTGASGRLQLAEWITSPANPLTARVLVNRVWLWLFGEGLVTTPDNFGTTGGQPANAALLDRLALDFEQEGWSLKKLVRMLVLSRTYGLASTYSDKAFATDPENTLLWRASRRRLDAECIRDAILASSGQLLAQPALGSVIARSGDGPVGGRRFRGLSEEAVVDAGAQTNLRSVYLPIARDLLPDALAVFDFAEPSLVTGKRESTNVPAQALFLLNSAFVTDAAQKLATRVLSGASASATAGVTANLEARTALAYWLALSRGPTAAERQAASSFFNGFPSHWKHGDDNRLGGPRDAEAGRAAWTSFCRALYASSEFRYLN